jgi:hypothetical protein
VAITNPSASGITLSRTCCHNGCQYWLKLSTIQPGQRPLLPGH